MNGATGVIDAAIVYGARRFFDRVHSDELWPYRDQYQEEDDSLLFFELLHYVIAYDHIILDSSSITELGPEIEAFIFRLNEGIGYEWLVSKDIAYKSIGDLGHIQSGICTLVSKLVRRGVISESVLEEIPVPWAYSRDSHHDYSTFAQLADYKHMDRRWLPFTIFLWRGILYSSFANTHAKDGPCAYLAAPGRLAAMQVALSSAEVRRAQYPREELVELIMGIQGLPKDGYDFSSFTSLPPYARSNLTLQIAKMQREDALEFAIATRATNVHLREEWAERLFYLSPSCAIGSGITQNAAGITAGGSVTQTQIIYATPRY